MGNLKSIDQITRVINNNNKINTPKVFIHFLMKLEF